MRACFTLVVLAGCDVVFGTSASSTPDAPATGDDATLGEVWTCPALPDFASWVTVQLSIGGGPHHPTLDITRDQLFYNASGDVWSVTFSSPGQAIHEDGLSSAGPDDAPTLWPDDAHMFVQQGASLVEGTRTGSTWQVELFAMPPELNGTVSAPAPTPDHDFRIIVAAVTGGLAELVRPQGSAKLEQVATLGNLAAFTTARDPYLSPDGCWLVFAAQMTTFDLFASERATDGQWKPPIRLAQQSTGSDELAPSMSSDGQHLLWNQGTSLMHAHP